MLGTNLALQYLRQLDSEGPEVVDALTHDRGPPSKTLASPHAFICNGGIYWLKVKAQYGLEAELIAGRLAAQLGVGPNAMPVRVSEAALKSAPSDAGRLRGLAVGTVDTPNTENGKDVGQLHRAQIEESSWARAVAFQSWIGVQDAQMLIRLSDGKVYSIDHGGAFGSVTLPAAKPAPIPAAIGGVSFDPVGSAKPLMDMVTNIESLADEILVEAVARVPDEWSVSESRRIQIAEWLGERRPLLRPVMHTWSQSP